MKKVLVFLAFIVVASVASAQEMFNPYHFYNDNTALVIGDGHVHFEYPLFYHNDSILVHHGVHFRYDRYDKEINMAVMIRTLETKYKNKGFNIEDGLSLIYSFIKGNGTVKSGQTLNRKGNFFIINENGRAWAILVGWSDIQHKWAMLALDESDIKGDEWTYNWKYASVICKN